MTRVDPDNGRRFSVMIVEGQVMMAEALHMALSGRPDIEIVGVAATLAAATGLLADRAPDVVVLDAQLPDGSVIDAIRQLKQHAPISSVLVLGGQPSYDSVVRTLEAGADGYVLRDQRIGELVDAVRGVVAGDRPLAPQLVTLLLSRLTSSQGPGAALSRREVEVLGHLAEGRSTAEMAARMGLTVNTVRNHVQHVIRRLGAHSKLEAVAIARREGLIGRPGLTEAS